MSHPENDSPRYVPVRKGLIAEPIESPEALRLLGSKCGACGELSLGTNAVCLNCGGSEIALIPLTREGVIWTYTVVRHKPPGDYRGPEPFEPFGLALVELPEGIRIMAPIHCDLEAMHVGLRVRLVPQVLDGKNSPPIVAFAFTPVDRGKSHV